MKTLKMIFRVFFRLFAIGSSAYVGYHCPETVLALTLLMWMFLAVWAFSSDDKPL